jgi:hypothetical protein
MQPAKSFLIQRLGKDIG